MLSLRNQEGASIVTVLVAAAMAGFLALGLSRMHDKAMRATKNIELKDDLLSLRRAFRNTVDCSATLTGVNCGSGYIPLKDRNNAVIGTPNLGTWKFGSYHIRASCNGSTLQIESARLATATTFLNDPLTNKPAAWDPLFPPGELDCADFFAASTPTPSCGQPFCSTTRGNYAIAVGHLKKATPQVACAALRDDSSLDEVHYTGIAFCPPGYSATGGGGECQVPPHGGSYHGSQITADGRGWFVDCCTYVGPNTPSTFSNAVFVTCRKDGT